MTGETWKERMQKEVIEKGKTRLAEINRVLPDMIKEKKEIEDFLNDYAEKTFRSTVADKKPKESEKGISFKLPSDNGKPDRTFVLYPSIINQILRLRSPFKTRDIFPIISQMHTLNSWRVKGYIHYLLEQKRIAKTGVMGYYNILPESPIITKSRPDRDIRVIEKDEPLPKITLT